MNPIPGVEVILISRDTITPYSGMLPGRLANWYTDDEMHFNLQAICAQSGVLFLEDEVTLIDPKLKTITLANRPPLTYDFASINVGITPSLPPGALECAQVIAVKPISRMLDQWSKIWATPTNELKRIAIIGGGPAGYELAVATQLELTRLKQAGQVMLVDSGDQVLSRAGDRLRSIATARLKILGVQIHTQCKVREVQEQQLILESGEPIPFEFALFATRAKAPRFIENSKLPVDELGFVKVDHNLLVLGHNNLFATGDCAHFAPKPLSKAGIYAVRQGPILIENLRRCLEQQLPLVKYKPQRLALALLISGDQRALLWYGPLAIEGKWVWKWKNHIDKTFMKRFGPMKMQGLGTNHNTCGGCGGKIPASELADTVRALKQNPEFATLLPQSIEDIGTLNETSMTVDGFRSFTDDLYFFGQVAAWHALNDFYASGLSPSGVTVFVGLPESSRTIRLNRLQHLMEGVLFTLSEAKAPLLNAHSAITAESTLVMSGISQHSTPAWSKGGVKPGDQLILTKPLGTGSLLQALMMGSLPSNTWPSLKQTLLQNHSALPSALEGFEVNAATDVSGFGLVGHLQEMLGGHLGANLNLNKIKKIKGFDDAVQQKFLSRLSEQNFLDFALRTEGSIEEPILWDPQTHGPILLCVAPADAAKVMLKLTQLGFENARNIGEIIASPAKVNIFTSLWEVSG